jgi:hypothetical protein
VPIGGTIRKRHSPTILRVVLHGKVRWRFEHDGALCLEPDGYARSKAAPSPVWGTHKTRERRLLQYHAGATQVDAVTLCGRLHAVLPTIVPAHVHVIDLVEQDRCAGGTVLLGRFSY